LRQARDYPAGSVPLVMNYSEVWSDEGVVESWSVMDETGYFSWHFIHDGEFIRRPLPAGSVQFGLTEVRRLS